MTFDVIKFYKDYRIPVQDRGKHVRPGWINTDCPFCHGRDGHLGVHIETGAVKCWKCGKHAMVNVIMALLRIDFPMAKELLENYTLNSRARRSREATENLLGAKKSVCEYPSGTGPLTDRHKAYLEERGFDADQLEKDWGLKGTGNVGDYKFRIIAPIMVNGVMVSYQGRDITDKSGLRYKACKQCDEVIEHQNTLYGMDHAKGGTCAIVEGITDVWRFGYGFLSCYGTAFTLAQVNLIASRYRKVFIIFDADDSNAMAMAEELACLLSARGVEVEIVDISDTPRNMLVNPNKGIDPGNLKQEYADYIRRELGL